MADPTSRNKLAVVAALVAVALGGIGGAALLDTGDALSGGSSTPVVAMPGSPAPAAAADPALTPADQALEAKLQPYIHCMNGVDRELEQFRGKYVRELQDIRQTLAGKPPAFPSNIPALRFTLNGFMSSTDLAGECAAGLERVVDQPPVDAGLDQAGRDYAAALRSIAPVLAEAETYYQQKDWKDDKFAKGASIDGRLRPLFDTAERAAVTIRAALRVQEGGLRTRQLAAVEARDGRSARWQGLNVMMRAREVQNEAGQQARTGSFSAKALQLGIEQLSAAWDEANAYAAAHPAPGTGGGRRAVWDRISQSASRYLASAKELRRAVEANDRKPDAVRSAYNSALSDFNSLVDSFNAQY